MVEGEVPTHHCQPCILPIPSMNRKPVAKGAPISCTTTRHCWFSCRHGHTIKSSRMGKLTSFCAFNSAQIDRCSRHRRGSKSWASAEHDINSTLRSNSHVRVAADYARLVWQDHPTTRHPVTPLWLTPDNALKCFRIHTSGRVTCRSWSVIKIAFKHQDMPMAKVIVNLYPKGVKLETVL